MISTCPEFRVVSTSSLFILSNPPRSTENSHVTVTNDSLLPISEFISLSSSYSSQQQHLTQMVAHSVLKHSLHLASKRHSSLSSRHCSHLHNFLCWLLLIFPVSGVPQDCHHTSILLYLLSLTNLIFLKTLKPAAC